jgi:hypothetical protein
MTLTPDQIQNLEHKAATIIGTALLTYAKSNPQSSFSEPLEGLGGALVAWALVKSNTLNSTPATPPPKV